MGFFDFLKPSKTQYADSIHEFKVKALNSDKLIDFASFKGKKIMIVNVASKCAFTFQYEGLEKLYQQHKDELVIVGFPCNQFLMQESGSESKIAEFCSINYGVTFPMTQKVHVKGRTQHPIYKWLTKKNLNGKGDFTVKWNFSKFILDEEGQILDHFGSRTEPSDPRIIALIKGNND